MSSEKLEKAGTVDFKKHPARKVGTRIPAVWTFPAPEILEFVAFRNSEKIFSSCFPGKGTFPEFSSRTPAQTPETATAFSSFLNERKVFLWKFHAVWVFWPPPPTFLRGSSSHTRLLAGTDVGTGVGLWGGGILLLSPTVWAGSGESRGHAQARAHTHTHTHTEERTRKCGTYPLATYPLKSARSIASSGIRHGTRCCSCTCR